MPPKTQSLRKTQSKRSSSSTVNEELNDDKVEPYHCKGKFLEDFDALCRQAQITFIVPVVPRPRPPGTPMSTLTNSDSKDKTAPKTAKGAGSKEREAAAQPPQHAENESGEIPLEDPQPKTYSLRENLEYFRPKIQVEMDNPEKQDTLTEILIRAWKIDRTILDIFAQSFPTLERLTTLYFWHTGLTDETLKQLASILPKCPSLRTLILDANPIPFEHYEVLLNDDSSPIINLSLRHCRITERGAANLAQGLGTERRQNKKLQTLNLAYNSLGDNGAEHIAHSLKFNRTLLVLNLSSNDISDSGARHLAEVLNKFPLTGDELAYRRKLLLHSSISESVPTLQSARKQGGERRTSVNSSPTGAGRKKSGVTSVTMPKSKGGAAGGKSDGKDAAKAPKKDDKAAKKNATIAESKPTKAGGGKAGADKLAKTLGNPKGSGTNPGNRSGTQSEADNDDKFIISDGIPILDQDAELIENELFLPGNRCLLSLNLSKNSITSTGVHYFQKAIVFQESYIKTNFSTARNTSSSAAPVTPNQGLLRLELQRNDFDINRCEVYDKLQALLKSRCEPIFKNRENPEDTPTGGRDTVGTPHGKPRTGLRH